VELSADTDMTRLIVAELYAFESYLARGQDDTIEAEGDNYKNAVAHLRYTRAGTGREDNLAIARHKVALAKVPLVVKFVEELFKGGSGKLTLFAHHRDVITGLETQLSGYGPVTLHGATSSRAREEAVNRFHHDPGCRVFIGNIQAAGVGITLAPASAQCIFAELSWVPAEMTQAEDRLHRIGTRDHVLVQHLVLEGSLDAIMARVLVRKQEILSEVLSLVV
jgi:SWI/SNF-related matrix-associated actin-dependent regulator 1 of chromatin subfamily A